MRFAGRPGRSFPAVRLLAYYATLVLVGTLLVRHVPGFREALIAPIAQPGPDILSKLGSQNAPVAAAPWTGVFARGALTLLAMLGALATALPVAWALKRTRQLRYDPSLVQALIVLPIVVSGVVLVVKNSLALAFALAGIVAGVRFRQKLDEPEQAVYVLLALGIGLAAGVQALDVALVMSMVFTLVVLILWRYDLGDLFAGGRGAQLAIGDPNLLEPTPREALRGVQKLEEAVSEGMKPSGMLVVRTQHLVEAREGIERVLGRMASQWRISEPIPDPSGGPERLEITVQLKDKCDPAELIAELETRLLDVITAAEYVPFGGAATVD
jgi:hypothetical protein